MVGGQPSLEKLADGQEGCGTSDGPVLSELCRQFGSTIPGILSSAMEPERALHRPTRHRVNADGDADLEHAGPPLPQRSLAPGAHRAKNRVINRATGGSSLWPSAAFRPLNRENAPEILRARQDSKPATF